MRTIQHWIDGAETPRVSTRTGTVFNPATGQQQAEVLLAERDDVDRAVGRRRGRVPAWSQSSLSRRTKILFAFREIVNRRQDGSPRPSPTSTARCSRTPRARCSAGSRSSSSPAASRACSRASYSDQVSTGVDATPSASRSAWSPASRRSTSRPWCRCGCSRWRSPAATRSSSSPASGTPRASMLLAELWAEAGLPAGVFNVVHGDKVAVDALLDHPDVAAVSFVGSTPDRPLRARARHGGRQAGAGARRREEPRRRAARRRPRLRRRPPGRRRLRLGRGAVHGDLRRRSPSARSATTLIDVLDRRRPRRPGGPGRDAGSEMGPIVTSASRDRIVGADHVGRGERRQGRRRRPRTSSSPATRTASSSARPCSTRSARTMDVYTRGDLRSGALGAARRRPRRGHRPDQRQPLRQRHGGLHLARRGRPPVRRAASTSA